MGCTRADFYGEDFYNEDFQVDTFLNKFRKWFRDLLPAHIIERDTYKDNLGRGLYERYMLLFGAYIDDDIIPEIECYLNIIDASIAEEKYLNHISDVLGNPPDVFKNIDQYRNLLSYIVSVYKIKGTKQAYELFFGILGFNIIITEEDPSLLLSLYDEGMLYDDGSLYDQGKCHPCSTYSIEFYASDPNDPILDATTLNLLRAAIDFNEPINAVLSGLTLTVNIEDEMQISIDEESGHEVVPLPYFDSGLEYDDDEGYDTEVEIQAIISHVLWKNLKDGQTLHLEADFLTNTLPSGFDYDFDKSYVNVISRNVVNQILKEQVYNFEEFDSDISYVNTLVANSYSLPEDTTYINLRGRIYLSNNTFFSFNENIEFNINRYTNLYFNTF